MLLPATPEYTLRASRRVLEAVSSHRVNSRMTSRFLRRALVGPRHLRGLLSLLLLAVFSLPTAIFAGVFFLHTDNRRNLPLLSSCSVESVARNNPEETVTIFSNAWGDNDGFVGQSPLRALPPNIVVEPLDVDEIFSGLPYLQQWYRKAAAWGKGYPLNNLSNAIRLALILKRGGTYLDLDMIVVKPLNHGGHKNAIGIEAEEGDLESVVSNAGGLAINKSTSASASLPFFPCTVS